MARKVMLLSMLVVTLAFLPGCIIHDPGYYPYDRVYRYGPHPYYYEPYFYAPIWFGGSYYFGDFGRGGDFDGHRGVTRHGGRGGGRR